MLDKGGRESCFVRSVSLATMMLASKKFLDNSVQISCEHLEIIRNSPLIEVAFVLLQWKMQMSGVQEKYVSLSTNRNTSSRKVESDSV